MSESRTILKNLFSFGSAELISKGLAVVYTIYFLRIIGPEGNGIINFAKSFVQYFLIFVMLGFDQIGTIEVAKNRNSMQEYVNAILSIRIVIALFGYLLLFLILTLFENYLQFSSLTTQVILIYGLNLFNIALLLSWVFLAIEKPQIIAVRSIISNFLNLIAVYLLVKSSDDVIPAVWLITLTLTLNSVWFMYVYLKKFGKKIYFLFDYDLWNRIIRDSFTVGMIWLIVTMYHYINITMLGFLTTKTETGLFSAAHSFLILMLLPSSIMQSIFFPKFSQTVENDDLKNINTKFMKLLMFVGVYLTFTGLCYSDLILSVLGKKYFDASIIMKYISITIFLTYSTITYFSPLIARKKANVVLYANLSGLVINVVSNIILIPMYGVIGAAISTIFSELTVTIVMTIIYKKFFQHHFTTNIITNLLIGLVGFSPFLLTYFYNLNGYITLFLSSILYLILILGFKLTTIEEIRRLLKK